MKRVYRDREAGGGRAGKRLGRVLGAIFVALLAVVRAAGRGLRAAASKAILWFRGGRSPQQKKFRRRTVPLGIIAATSALVGLGVGAAAGGDSSDRSGTVAAVDATSITKRPRIIGCEPGTQGTITNGSRARKQVALTFDDGPGPETRDVVEILKEHSAKATFFVLGDAAKSDPELVAELVVEGFEVGTHSMSHDQYPDSADMAESRRVVFEASGFMPCLFRPPYGLTNATVEANAATNGMANILWDVDTSDYAAASASEILSQIESTTSGSILVMHDGPINRQATVDALPMLIEKLKAQGFELVTVTELLGNSFIPAPR